MRVFDVMPPKRWLKERRKKKFEYARLTVNKFFDELETRGGVVGDKAVLFVYNEQAPELSYILTEQL